MRILLALITVAFVLPAAAGNAARPKPKDLQVIDDVPPPPRIDDSKKAPEPKITTRKVGNDTIQEYRMNGKLYQQRIQPANGPAYYLIDEKGEGKFARVDGPDVKYSLPMWVLLEW